MSITIPKAYIVPHDTSAFGLVGKHYLESLREHYPVRDIPMTALLFYVTIFRYGDVIMHPLLYAGLRGTMPKCRTLIGVEVADSDRISKEAIKVVNKANMLIVPSYFSKKAYLSSGAKIPIEVVQHGFPDEWLTKPKDRFSFALLRLARMKGSVRCLFFHIHSLLLQKADFTFTFSFSNSICFHWILIHYCFKSA